VAAEARVTVTCAECGRQGTREFAAAADGGSVCTHQVACLRRQVDAVRRELRARGKRRLPRARVHRDTSEIADAGKRLILAVGRRVAAEDPDALKHLQALGAALDDAFAAGVEGLRSNYSDRVIGDELGVTRQAVEQRWPRPRNTASEETQ
jgi:hypothetical protein